MNEAVTYDISINDQRILEGAPLGDGGGSTEEGGGDSSGGDESESEE
jgi:hypothetical protein